MKMQKWQIMTLSCSEKTSAFLRGKTSKYYSDFPGLNCFHSLRTSNNFELRKRVCKNKDFCNIITPADLNV